MMHQIQCWNVLAERKWIIMAMAFIMLMSTLGSENDILKVMNDIPGVRESFMVYGVYDIILKIETDTMGELKELINKIKNAEKVRAAISIIVI